MDLDTKDKRSLPGLCGWWGFLVSPRKTTKKDMPPGWAAKREGSGTRKPKGWFNGSRRSKNPSVPVSRVLQQTRRRRLGLDLLIKTKTGDLKSARVATTKMSTSQVKTSNRRKQLEGGLRGGGRPSQRYAGSGEVQQLPIERTDDTGLTLYKLK